METCCIFSSWDKDGSDEMSGGVTLSLVELTVIGCKLCLPHGNFGYMCREQETVKSPDIF